jgi:regulator of protease activity HflC (stomatin/prohibitin superfamily)
MEAKEKQRIPGLGSWLLAILLLGGVGALLHDFNGVGYGAAGALIWGGAVLLTFVLCTAYVSRRVLPLQDNAGWSAGFRLLWRNYTLGAAELLYGRRGPVIDLSATKPKKPPKTELSPSFGLLGAGFLFSHEAAAITRGNGYSRADGPGLIFLHGGESIAQVFDLRPQARKMPVSALTRDGIPIETSVSVVFQVRRPAPGRRPRSIESDAIPYPYDREALFELTYSTSMEDDERRDWTEQVCPQAAALLVTEISKYTLDELLVGAAAEPLSEIKERVKSGLKEQQGDHLQTLPQGIEIVNVGVGGLELPADVTAKRLSSWQVEWQNRITQETIGGDIEAQRIYADAHARAQVENLENLLLSIDAMRRQSGVELHEVVMTRIVEVLESLSATQALGPSTTRAAITSLAAEATSELRRALEPDEE